MSSSVTPPPVFVMPAPPPPATTVLLPSPPPELQQYPAGTVFNALLIPPATSADLPVLTISLPDGKEISFPVKITPVPVSDTPVMLKVMPPEIKDTLSLRMQHVPPVPLPSHPEIPAKAPAENLISDNAVKPASTVSFDAFILKNIPLPVSSGISAPLITNPVPEGTKITFQIIPPAVNTISQQTQESPTPKTELTAALQENQAINPLARQNTLPPLQTAGISLKPEPETLPQKPVVSPSFSTLPPAPGIEENLFPGKETVLPQTARIPNILMQTETEITQTAMNILKTPQDKPDGSFSPVLLTEAKNNPYQTNKLLPAELQNTPEKLVETNVPSPLSAPSVSQPPLLRPNMILEGTLLRLQAEKPALIATKIGLLAMDKNVDLPHLTPVALKITDIQLPTLIEKEPLPTFRNTWTIISHALETLKQTDETAYQAVKQILPQTGHKLPALMISFMTAAANGENFMSWLGESNVSALQKLGAQGETILRRMEKEFSTSAKKVTDGQNNWRGWDIPLLSGSIVEPVSLFLQKPPAESEHSSGQPANIKSGVRFVLDLNLTRLGRMQMEGLAYREKRLFDLTLRHQKTMPDSFEPVVRSLFSTTLDALNYAGTLRLNKTDEFIDFRPENEKEPTVKRGVLV